MTTSRNEGNSKVMEDVSVTTDWSTLIEVSPNNAPATFFVWSDAASTKPTRLRFDFSYDGSRWVTSVNGSGASINMGAAKSVLVTPMDFTNDIYIQAPHYRLMAKKITTRESMNASAWWPDNR